jgi:hypothetical protein
VFLRLNESTRRADRSVLGLSVVSLGVHAALILGGVYAIRTAGRNPATVRADTTVVFLESPQVVPQQHPVELDVPLKGFRTIVAPPQIPTSIPPVDLQQHFDPRDYSGTGVEGGLANGAAILKSPNPGFNLPTRRWALEARFRPARLQGRAVRVLVNLPFDFSMATSGS